MSATERTFSEALRLHQAGRLAEAEQLYRTVLSSVPEHADSMHCLGVIALQGGNLDGAFDLITRAIRSKPNTAVYYSNLGLVCQNQGKLDQAVTHFERALALEARYPEAHNNLGVALQRKGKLVQAAAHFEQALKLRPGYSEAAGNLAHLHFIFGNSASQEGRLKAAVEHYSRCLALVPSFAEAEFNLGNALRDLGQLEEAAAAYERALLLDPRLTPAYLALGVLLLVQDRPQEAAARFEKALAVDANLAEAHYNLAIALMGLDQPGEAIARFEQALKLKSDFTAAHFNLGNALQDMGRRAEAAAHYEKTLALAPDFAEAHIALGNLRIGDGTPDAAQPHFREAQRLQPVRRQAAVRAKPEFSALALTAPGPVNTPTDYLLARVGFDSHFVMLLPGVEPNIPALRALGHVVINLIAEVDVARGALLAAAELADQFDQPVINHPRKMLVTDRVTVAERLSTVQHCRVAKVIRLEPNERSIPEDIDLRFPVLARITGTHGGKHLEKCDNTAALAAALGGHGDSAHYISEYLPYQSSDGRFRKYRLIFVNGKILPYHLAIGSHWKMHYFSSDMAKEPSLREEEAAFLQDPHSVFGPKLWGALECVRTALDLDFAGIDCSIDNEGRLVVFEANATMLVHDEKGVFAYKAPFIADIKQAFESMLALAALR